MNRRQVLRNLALGSAALAMVGPRRTIADGPATGATAQTTPPPAAPVGPFTLPSLGYAFDALEPHLDAQTMQIHHDKHHAAYVANLNKAVAGRKEVEGWSVERLLQFLATAPEDIRTAIRNHGGGHFNHSLLWTSLKKDGAHEPTGDLARAVDSAFGAFSSCRERLSAAALGVFGSGWAWLTTDSKGVLQVETTPNQDSPLSGGRTPLVGIDVWEHAYYLKYQNRRADYLAAFANVIDWSVISERYQQAKHG